MAAKKSAKKKATPKKSTRSKRKASATRKSRKKTAVPKATRGTASVEAEATPRGLSVSAEAPRDAPMDVPVRPLRPAPGEVIVRMYRQGLGDCFLLAFGTKQSADPRYVLIDCGVHSWQKQGPQRMMQVMKHLVKATKNHLHVVAVTHEHSDHLSGFVQRDSPFLDDAMKIDKLWVAWTEEVGDEDADRLRKEKATARELIRRAVDKALEEARGRNNTAMEKRFGELRERHEAYEDPIDDEQRTRIVKNILDMANENPGPRAMLAPFMSRFVDTPPGLAADSKPSGSELALGLLAVKANANAKYCDPGDVLTMSEVEGVRVYALGPPKLDDRKLLKKDSPSKVRGGGDHEYKETYLSGGHATQSLALSPALRTGDENRGALDRQHPFRYEYRRRLEPETSGAGEQWDRDAEDASEKTADFFATHYDAADNDWRRIDTDWLGAAEQLALHLGNDTNNTSLVLAFELGEPGSGSVMLFPGDAQVGNWLSWRDRDYRFGDTTVSVDDLLRRTLLYKVGHHGSHNATLKHFVEPRSNDPLEPYGLELMDDIIAMIPIDRAAANHWPMPHRPLYMRLRSKADRRVLRSDQTTKPLTASAEKDIAPESPTFEEIPGKPGLRWRRSVEEFTHGTPGPLYYDIRIPIG